MRTDIQDTLAGVQVAVKLERLAEHFKVSQSDLHQLLVNSGVDRLYTAIDLKKPGSMLELHNHLHYDMAMFTERFQELVLLKTQMQEREEELKALTARAKQLLDQAAAKLNQAP